MKQKTIEELKEIVKKIFEVNNEDDLYLSGSIGLEIQGISNRRTPADIDILFIGKGKFVMPDGCKESVEYDFYEGSEEDYEIKTFRMDGVKIDLFVPYYPIEKIDEHRYITFESINILNPHEIIKFKVHHALDCASSSIKHKFDVIHIMANNGGY